MRKKPKKTGSFFAKNGQKSGSKFKKMAQKNLIGKNGGERKINLSANPETSKHIEKVLNVVYSFQYLALYHSQRLRHVININRRNRN